MEEMTLSDVLGQLMDVPCATSCSLLGYCPLSTATVPKLVYMGTLEGIHDWYFGWQDSWVARPQTESMSRHGRESAINYSGPQMLSRLCLGSFQFRSPASANRDKPSSLWPSSCEHHIGLLSPPSLGGNSNETADTNTTLRKCLLLFISGERSLYGEDRRKNNQRPKYRLQMGENNK